MGVVYNIMEAIISKQNIKEFNQNLMPTDRLNISDEREEGEIIDDYELILSSEEEYSVRERMRELEATNNEIEQIAEISGSYANNYNYCSGINFHEKYQPYKHLKRDEYVISDISSISSDEFHVPKKKRHRSKKNRSKRMEQTCKKEISSKHGKRRNHIHRSENKKPRRNVYLNKQRKRESNLSDLNNSVLMNSDMKYWGDDNDYIMNGITREELRFALAHDTKRDAPIGSLKERLENKLNCLKADAQCHQKSKEQDQNKSPQNFERNKDCEKGVIIDCESNSGDSMEESELRLIALKSAVLNKHNLRKKRNAEMAYSPTDFIENEEFKNIDECDIDEIMEISPAESPLIEIRDPLDETSVNMKPVDMDIVTSEESDSEITQNSNLEIQWPLPANNYNHINDIDLILQCGLYMSGLKQGDQLQNILDDEEPPPPPPFYISKEQLDEDSSNNSYNFDTYHPNLIVEKQSMPIKNRIDLTESSDEEEKALRALLLSNHKFVKRDIEIARKESQPQPMHGLSNSVSDSIETENQKNFSYDENEDPEELRSLLLLSMKNKDNHSHGSPPSVLKEAVQRFQLNSKDNNYLVSISTEDEASKNNYCNTLPMEIVENEEKILPEESNIDRSNISNSTCFDKVLTTNAVPPNAEKLASSIYCKNIVKSQLCTKNVAKRSSASPKIVLKHQTETKIDSSGAAVLNPKPLNSIVSVPTKPKDTLIKTNHTLKIVKPNKVINKNSDLKQKASMTFANQQQSTKEEVGTNFSRLLTKADISKITVKRMIINLSSSTSESEESNFSDHQNEQNMAIDSLPLTYSDNASPISLPMESPCGTPPRSSTPSIENTETPFFTANLRKSAMNEFFERKLDEFLKQARFNVEKSSGTEKKIAFGRTEKENSDSNMNVSVGIETPLSVRHLPAASQQEYRFLVERMKILEKRKEFRSLNDTNNKGIKTTPKEVLDIENKSHPATCTDFHTTGTNVRNNTLQGHLSKSTKTVNKSLFAKSAIPNYDLSLQTKVISQNLDTQSPISSPMSVYSLQTNVRSSLSNLKKKTPTIVMPASVQLSSTKTELEKSSPTKTFLLSKTLRKAVTVDKCKPSRTFSVFAQSSNGNNNNSKSGQQINPIKHIDPAKNDGFVDKPFQFNYSKKNNLDKSMFVVKQTSSDSLHTLESSYTSIGADMISHLNKTLVMVEQAKTSKITRLHLDKRLEELHNEVNEVTLKLKYEKIKVSQIEPHIHQSNDLLSQLKMRRTKLYDAAMHLGKTIQGTSEYRYFTQIEQVIQKDLEKFLCLTMLLNKLYDEATTEISQKSNKLSREIQLLNSLKTFDDIKEIEEAGNVDRNQVETETIKYCENKNISDTIEIRDFAEVKKNQLLDLKEISIDDNCENIVKMDENCISRKFTNQESEGSCPLICNSEKVYEKNAVLSDINVHIAPSESLPKNLKKTIYNDKVRVDRLSSIYKLSPKKKLIAGRRAVIFKNQQKETQYTEPSFKVLINQPHSKIQKKHYNYISPLQPQTDFESSVNPDGLVCPYDLMGNCEDTECPFMHL